MANKVLFDRYRFTVQPAWQGARPDSVTLFRGDDVAEAFKASILGADRELARAKALGAVGDDEAVAVAVAASTPGSAVLPVGMTEEQLGKMKVEDLVAFAQQYATHPGVIDTILRLEYERKSPRKAIVALDPTADPDRLADPNRDPAGEAERQAADERAREAEAQARQAASQAASGAGVGH
jgi:hypothetical protein